MKIQEIKAKDLKPKKFIDEKVREIREIAGDGIAISALSGGVDSSVVTALAHKALGKKLKTYFIDNGIMREGEPKKVKALFAELGIAVTIVDARQAFFDAMKGITDPELKREAITQTFYKKVFRDLVLKSKATVLLQGTILTDVEETAAGIKRQHNVFEQIGSLSLQKLRILENKSLFQIKKTNIVIQLHIYDNRCIFRKDKRLVRGHTRTEATRGHAKIGFPMPNQSAGSRSEAVLQNRDAASGLRARR